MADVEINQIIAVGTIVLIFLGVITILSLIWGNPTLSNELKVSLTNSLFLALFAVSTIASAYLKKNTKKPKKT